MKTADVHRFLVVCALVPDLYCPGFNPRQPLGKNSNLARAALRYKVNAAQITVSVRAELSKNRKETRTGSSSHKGSTRTTARTDKVFSQRRAR